MGLEPKFMSRCHEENKTLSQPVIDDFRREIYRHYRASRRPMPWRETNDPYCILVSEIMLQQTQVSRVLLKYEQFLDAFPTITDLSKASISEVVTLWSGLGYNRRALALKRCADLVVEQFGGHLPATIEGLEALPGIGPYTARAVAAFSYGVATPFIETNIRTVFIHFFFAGRDAVPDRDIMPLIAATLDSGNPREWYYALMDYGVMVKHKYPNPGRRSQHHTKQSKFEGSNRQLRSRLLQAVLGCKRNSGVSAEFLAESLGCGREQVTINLETLVNEGFLEKTGDDFHMNRGTKKG